MPYDEDFWKCAFSEDFLPAVKARVIWINLHDFQGFDIVPQMSPEAKEAFEAPDPTARVEADQCWPLHLPGIAHSHPNAVADADESAAHPSSPPVSLRTRMRSALQVSADECDDTTSVIEAIVCHPAFPELADDIKTAFDGPWTANTRGLLVRALTGKIPQLGGYYLKYMIHSLSYVYKLSEIPCRDTYCNMSNEAIKILEAGEIKPSDVINYTRDVGDLGTVTDGILPDDDMALELALCQTYGIFKKLVEDDQ